METYQQLRKRQQEEFNKLPLMFAFSDEQFEEGMRKWGLSPEDTDKLYKVSGGGFIQKKDAHLMKEVLKRHPKEIQAAIDNDKTGDGFIYQMFKYELANYEFGYTWDVEDTLDALGFTIEQVNKEPKLKHGLDKAIDDFRNEEE